MGPISLQWDSPDGPHPCGWVPLRKTIKATHCLGPGCPMGVRRGSLSHSKWPHWPQGPKVGQKQAKGLKPVPNHYQYPLGSRHPGLNPPSVTHGVPMERYEPRGTQGGAYHGPFGAGLPTPNPILGSLWAKTVIWPYLGLHGLNRNSKGTSPRSSLPLFVAYTPQNRPDAPLDTCELSWAVMGCRSSRSVLPLTGVRRDPQLVECMK